MLSESNREAIHGLVLAKKQMKGGLLPILHDIQDLVGYIPEQSVAVIAKELNLSRAEVHGVITFYHYFRQAKTGRNIVQICRAEACRSMGSESLWEHACNRLEVSAETSDARAGTDADADCSVHAVYCLGLCSSSPAMSINDKVYARVDADKFDRLLALTRSST